MHELYERNWLLVAWAIYERYENMKLRASASVKKIRTTRFLHGDPSHSFFAALPHPIQLPDNLETTFRSDAGKRIQVFFVPFFSCTGTYIVGQRRKQCIKDGCNQPTRHEKAPSALLIIHANAFSHVLHVSIIPFRYSPPFRTLVCSIFHPHIYAHPPWPHEPRDHCILRSTVVAAAGDSVRRCSRFQRSLKEIYLRSRTERLLSRRLAARQ